MSESVDKEDYTSFYNKLPLCVNPIIDDTTLRDGIQMPGTAVSPRHATHIAYLLDAIGVERLEFFQYQKPDQEAVKLIQDLSLGARLCGWCRAVKEDVDIALKLDETYFTEFIIIIFVAHERLFVAIRS